MGCYPTGGFYELESAAAAARWRWGLLSNAVTQPPLVPSSGFKTQTADFPSGGKEHPSRGESLWRLFLLLNTSKPRRADGSEGAESYAAIRCRFRGARDHGELQRSRPVDFLSRLSRPPR